MSTLSVSTGYSTIEEEFEDSLRRAFVDHRAKVIFVTSRRQRFLGESAGYGVERGWLQGKLNDFDEQSSFYEFSLTDDGRKHFGLEAEG